MAGFITLRRGCSLISPGCIQPAPCLRSLCLTGQGESQGEPQDPKLHAYPLTQTGAAASITQAETLQTGRLALGFLVKHLIYLTFI